MDGRETLSYETLAEVRNKILSISAEMSENFEESKRIMEAIENEKIFVTDLGSKAMQSKYADFIATFEPFIEKLNEYGDFLTNEVNAKAKSTDSESSSRFKSLADSFLTLVKPKGK